MKKVLFVLCILLCSMAVKTAYASAIYGVSPFYFSRGYNKNSFLMIKNRLKEIKSLGVDVIWLQPIFPSAEPGQGYDTINFYKINSEFGTDDDFRKLITEAHRSGLKVILDIALNHTSLEHPHAKDAIKSGASSEYFDFYQHEVIPNIPYARHFNQRIEGQSSFIYYFWEKLINLNYSNPAVQKSAVDIVTFWVKEYDVDGYRFDASWGPSSRWPDFYHTISSSLRNVKKDVILIAEDKANYPVEYKETNHPHFKNSSFNFGYDWNSEDPDWMSKWTFQTGDEHSETLFNESDKKSAVKTFVAALKVGMKKASVPALRYIENNDTGSFLQHHSRKQTQFAAAIMIFLPGTPLLFYGQAEGINYSQWNLPSIDPEKSLRSYDPEMWDFYQKLLKIRQQIGELKTITAIKVLKFTTVEMIIDQKHKLFVDFKNETVSFNEQLVTKSL